MEDDTSLEFTIAEVMEMENLFKKMRGESVSEEFCQELTVKFNSSHRSENSSLNWEQVQRYFQDKQKAIAAKLTPLPTPLPTPRGTFASSKAVVLKMKTKEHTISASEASVELSNLNFEARSAKDYAWFDVGCFLNYRVLYSGQLEVRVRFAGFGYEEDEWVNVKSAIRDRSIPLDPSECGRVYVGDLVLCYREAQHHALYIDAYIMEIERHSHGSESCTCIFVVRYDYDNFEEKVTLSKICARPTQSESGGSQEMDVCTFPGGSQEMDVCTFPGGSQEMDVCKFPELEYNVGFYP